MPSVNDIAREIVAREGGYVNDPDDPGGATNLGVTLGTLKRLRRDLDGDGTVSVADLKQLTPADAQQIFIEHYFRKPGLSRLPLSLQASVFDMQVNAGRNALRILQRLMAKFGHPVVVDGVMGPQTATSAHRVEKIAPDHFADAYGIARRNYYYRLGDRRRALRKFARRRDGGKGGWILRAEEFISERYHLSAADHERRVAKWV